MTIEETYAAWRASLKRPDDSIFYYHRDLERILLGLAIFVIASRPVAAKLRKAEMLKLFHLQVPDLITYWIDGEDKAFAQLFPMVMTEAQAYSRTAIAAEHRYPAEKKAIRMMACLFCNAGGAGGDMDQTLADELLDDLSTDGDDIYSDKISEYGQRLLALTRQHGVDVPLSKMADILSLKPSDSKQTAIGANAPGERNSPKGEVETPADPPRKSTSPSQQSIDALIAGGRPIDINELRDAIWNSEYSDPLFAAADQILFDLEHEKNTENTETGDQTLLEAAVAYDCRMGVQDCLAAKPTRISRHNRLVDWANQLTAIWKNRPPSENEMRAMNATTPLHDFFSAIDNQAAAKVTAKNLRIMAESIQRHKAPKSLGILEALVNARSICRRMPQELSCWIKDTFENISPVTGWADIMDEKSLRDRLRRLSIQSRVLEYLHYDVEGSYTGPAMQKERGEIFFSKESGNHLIFSRLLHDFNWRFATADYLQRYAAKLIEHASAATDPADILNYATSLLNVRLRQGVDIFAPLPPSSDKADSTPEIDGPPSAERSLATAQSSETDVLQSATNEWTEKAAPEYSRREIALWQKRKDELYEEMTEASERLKKILDELDQVKLRLSELNSLT